MRAILLSEYGGSDRLEVVEWPEPHAGPGEVRIRVASAGINPVDTKIRQGYLRERIPNRLPIVLGWEAAGVVDEVGDGVTGLAVGDEVWTYCRKPELADGGAYAEYVTVAAEHVGRAPTALSPQERGALPLVGLTALQCLGPTRATLMPGETVLILGAAGGVGSVATQLAVAAGATALGTASARNHEYLRGLGLAGAIDYTMTDVAGAVRATHPDGVDVLMDCVAGDEGTAALAAVRDGGRAVSILDRLDDGRDLGRGIAGFYKFVDPDRPGLDELARLAEAGQLTVHLDAVFPLEAAADAHDLIEQGHVRGKLTLTP